MGAIIKLQEKKRDFNIIRREFSCVALLFHW